MSELVKAFDMEHVVIRAARTDVHAVHMPAFADPQQTTSLLEGFDRLRRVLISLGTVRV